jgi:hypothetical protein
MVSSAVLRACDNHSCCSNFALNPEPAVPAASRVIRSLAGKCCVLWYMGQCRGTAGEGCHSSLHAVSVGAGFLEQASSVPFSSDKRNPFLTLSCCSLSAQGEEAAHDFLLGLLVMHPSVTAALASSTSAGAAVAAAAAAAAQDHADLGTQLGHMLTASFMAPGSRLRLC